MLDIVWRSIVYNQLYLSMLEVAIFKKRISVTAEKLLGLYQKRIFKKTFGQIVTKSLD
jgi:hypothetical protein